MSLISWLQSRKPVSARKRGKPRLRPASGLTTLPLISPRRGRRILRREQLFSVVRESLIRGGVLSTSYEFKVLTLDASGDSFLVLVDLALPAHVMPDEYLLEIESWVQESARLRHDMEVRSVYWRRQAVSDQRGMALKAAVAAQTRAKVASQSAGSADGTTSGVETSPRSRLQAVAADELEAFRRALKRAAPVAASRAALSETGEPLPAPESHSDFAALSATQYGKL